MENDKLRKEFLQFHRENPHVYKRIVELCEELWDRGWRKYSMRTIISVLRFQFDLETGGEEVTVAGGETRRVKLNDHHSPYYARMLVTEKRKFRDFFEFRRAEGEDGDGEIRAVVAEKPTRRSVMDRLKARR